MLHGIIQEQGNGLDVSDEYSEKILIFHMFPINL